MSNNNTFKNSLPKHQGIIFLYILFVSVTFQNIFADKKPCGKLLGGFNDDCIVIRGVERERIKPRVDMLLYPGDLILQKSNIEKICINSSGFVKKYDIHPNAIWIDYKHQEKENQLPKFLRWLTILKAAEHLSEYAYTRDINYEDIDPKHLYPKPGWKASLMPGESVLFGWESRSAKSFVIKDAQGNEVFRKQLESESSIELNVNEIGMKPSFKYYWGIEIKGIVDLRIKGELKLLPGDIVQVVNTGLKEIEKEKNLDSTYKALKKAAFLQFISDIYRADAELYWKSGQILARIDRHKLEDKQYRRLDQLLLLNYRGHHKKKLGRRQ